MTCSTLLRLRNLGNELAWYADVLGQVRDRDILSSRLTKQIAELPPEQVRGPVEAEIKKTLAAEREEAVGGLSKAMRTSRYAHLVQLLRGWRAAPPLMEAAGEESKAAVKYVEKAKQKADKRLRKADDDIERLHRARRATKRTRYAAELVEPADSEMKAVARTPRICRHFWASIRMPLSPPTSSPRSVLMATGQKEPDSPTGS
jgi:CHAD domain-containing protein